MCPRNPDGIADAMLDLLMGCRRSCPGDPACDCSCVCCRAPHRERILRFVREGEPVRLVLPAFPAKSPNRRKTLGPLPDTAEEIAVGFLGHLCQRIGEVYEPGARLTLCSDGHVFSDLVEVPDAEVSAYTAALRGLLEGSAESADGCSFREAGPRERIETFGLDHAFPGRDFTGRRRALADRYAPSLDQLRKEVRAGAPIRATFNGIARFLFEDLLALHGDRCSRTALRSEAGTRAYEVVRRSSAWSALVAERFPGAVRLSIHPQPCGAEKLGIYLVPSRDNWLTPWHGVAVEVAGRFTLMKRWQAEQLGAEPVLRDGRPVHFEARRIACLEDLATSLSLAAAVA